MMDIWQQNYETRIAIQRAAAKEDVRHNEELFKRVINHLQTHDTFSPRRDLDIPSGVDLPAIVAKVRGAKERAREDRFLAAELERWRERFCYDHENQTIRVKW